MHSGWSLTVGSHHHWLVGAGLLSGPLLPVNSWLEATRVGHSPSVEVVLQCTAGHGSALTILTQRLISNHPPRILTNLSHVPQIYIVKLSKQFARSEAA